MLSAVSLDKTLHNLIDMTVCDGNSNICMIHHCKSFPGISKVEKHLKEHFQLTDDPKRVSNEEDENRTYELEEGERKRSQPSPSNNGFQLARLILFLIQ